jgi:hypothetical protein
LESWYTLVSQYLYAIKVRVKYPGMKEFSIWDNLFVESLLNKAKISFVKKEIGGQEYLLVINPKGWDCPRVTPKKIAVEKGWFIVIIGCIKVLNENEDFKLMDNENPVPFDVAYFIFDRAFGQDHFSYIKSSEFQISQTTHDSLMD